MVDPDQPTGATPTTPSASAEGAAVPVPAAEPAETASRDAAAAPAPAESATGGPASAESAAREPAPADGATGEPAPAASAESDGDEGGEEGGDEPAEAGAEGAAAGAPGEGAGEGPKKKRRRRRKKKTGVGAEAAPGAEGAAPHAPPPQQQQREERRRKDTSHAPFVRFIDQASVSARRHMFSTGEIVAGRVTSVEGGVITLDLFGKAVAYIDASEPREIAPLPEKAEPTASGETHAPEAGEAAAADASTPGETPAAGDAQLDAAATDAAHEALAAEETPHDEAHEAREEAAEAAHAAELAAASPPPPLPEVGAVFRGRIAAIAESGTLALLNRKRDGRAARARVDEARDKHQRVSGIVYGFNRGGYDVFIDGLRAFCPASGMSLVAIDDPHVHVGHKLPFSVPPTKPGTHGLVVSRRSILEREARKDARDRIKALGVGQRVHGRVSQVRDFGLFLDLGGGLEGMIHVSEMGWDRHAKASDIAKVGDELDAQIIKIPDGRKERHERIGLSLKNVLPDPWDLQGELLAEGRVFKGKVNRVAEFGAFIEVAPGIDGLLHVTELGQKLAHAKDAVKEGDEVAVVIDRVDRKARRLSLSKLGAADAKALEAGTLSAVEIAKVPKPGQHLKVKVDRVEHHGVFVQVSGVIGKRGRGYIPNNEMATDRGTDHRKLFPVGTELDVKVIGQDRDGALKLSRKALQWDEEKRAVQDYRKEAAKQGFGTFGDLLRAKIGGDAPKT